MPLLSCLLFKCVCPSMAKCVRYFLKVCGDGYLCVCGEGGYENTLCVFVPLRQSVSELLCESSCHRERMRERERERKKERERSPFSKVLKFFES